MDTEEILRDSLQKITSFDEDSTILKAPQISDDERDAKDNSKLKSREKVHSKQASGIKPLTEEEAFVFINKKLNRKYASFSKLKNGKALGELLTIVSGYKVNSKDFWGDMADILIMEDKENYISVEKLKCSNIEEIVKLTSWLKSVDEELQSKKHHGGSSKGNCCI